MLPAGCGPSTSIKSMKSIEDKYENSFLFVATYNFPSVSFLRFDNAEGFQLYYAKISTDPPRSLMQIKVDPSP